MSIMFKRRHWCLIAIKSDLVVARQAYVFTSYDCSVILMIDARQHLTVECIIY